MNPPIQTLAFFPHIPCDRYRTNFSHQRYARSNAQSLHLVVTVDEQSRLMFQATSRAFALACRAPLIRGLATARAGVDSKYKVVVCMAQHFGGCTQSISARLPPSYSLVATDDILAEVEDAHVLIPYMAKIPAEIIEKGKTLRLIQQFGVGLEGVDIPSASRHDVAVCNIPAIGSGNDISVAEHALFLLFSLLRRAAQLRRSFQQELLGLPLGDVLEGKSVVVLGYGNVGKVLTRKLRALGTKVAVIRQSKWTEEQADEVDSALSVGTSREQLQQTLQEALKSAHILVIACPLTPQTLGIVDSNVLCTDRPIYVVNVARGAVIDQIGLQEALDNGRIAGLGLDVFWSEPFDPTSSVVDDTQHNIICTGHVGGHTVLANGLMSDVVVDNIKASAARSLSALKHCVNRDALGSSSTSVWQAE